MSSMSDEDLKVDRQPHLMKQDASKVDPTKLTALTPEVVSNLSVVHCEAV
jgi:hypothetical protein